MNDLLKVLDMSEDEQQIWLIKKEVMVGAVLQCKDGGELPCPSESFADLAFRLRDEVRREKGNYDHAVYIVFNYEKQKKKYENVFYWMAYIAQPIHWIIAALIAKEKEDE